MKRGLVIVSDKPAWEPKQSGLGANQDGDTLQNVPGVFDSPIFHGFPSASERPAMSGSNHATTRNVLDRSTPGEEP